MVSAVFHSPLERDPVTLSPSPSGGGMGRGHATLAQPALAPTPALPRKGREQIRLLTGREQIPFDWRGLWLKVLPPLLGIGLLIGLWAIVSMKSSSGFPSPIETFKQAVDVFSDPFYRKGPNDQGIGWNVLSSLKRVAFGFGMAALVGIPMGFMIGRFTFLSRMFNPLISLLRPVSPLAWLPIGLMVFKGANPAAIWTIFICSIWPMIINTAVGVQRVPSDYMNVARVLNLSEWKIITKILFPAVLPYMLTGVRLAVGTAWLVIVAAEMLTGGVGIGFWVWDEWNNLNVRNIIIAIFAIGMVGLVLEFALIKLATAFTFEEVKT